MKTDPIRVTDSTTRSMDTPPRQTRGANPRFNDEGLPFLDGCAHKKRTDGSLTTIVYTSPAAARTRKRADGSRTTTTEQRRAGLYDRRRITRYQQRTDRNNLRHFDRVRREDGRDILSDWDGPDKDMHETDVVRSLFADEPTALPGLPLHRLRKKHQPVIRDDEDAVDDDDAPSDPEEPTDEASPHHGTDEFHDSGESAEPNTCPSQEEPVPNSSTMRATSPQDHHVRAERGRLGEPESPPSARNDTTSTLDSDTRTTDAPSRTLTSTSSPASPSGPRRSARLRQRNTPPPRSKSVGARDGPTSSNSTTSPTGSSNTNDSVPGMDGFSNPDLHKHGPLGKRTLADYQAQEHRELASKVIRPVRLAKIGQRQQRTDHDDDFLRSATDKNFPVLFVSNPKKDKSASRKRYDAYQLATTLAEAVTLATSARPKGTTVTQARNTALADIRWDYEHGYILFPAHESLLDGHFIDARQLAADHKLECQAEHVPMAGTTTRGKYGPVDPTDATAGASTLDHMPGLSALRPLVANTSRRLEEADGPGSTETNEPLGEKLARARRTADALKYLENTTEVHAFVSTHLGRQRLFDASTNTYHVEPRNEHEALHGPDKDRWARADKEELDALQRFGTYELTHECKGRPMTTKIVRKIKVDDLGNVSRFKSRLVARGFMSRDGIEHDESELYAPVLQYTSFRTLNAIAAGKGWALRQTDISNAYLQGWLTDLEGNPRYIYVKDPLQRVDEQGRPLYLKLLRPLYGLRQSGRLWLNELHGHLLDSGFERVPTDKCLFKISIPRRDLDPTYNGDMVDELLVGTYVDDIPHTGSSELILDWFGDMLSKRFTINPHDTGAIKHMLGARIRQDLNAGVVTMDQTAAITALAKAHGLDKTNASSTNSTPMVQEPLPRVERTSDEDKEFHYLSAVGSLLHISLLTRPDISYAVGVCARHGAAYGKPHIRAVRRIIAYLYHSRHHGLVYSRQASGDPSAHIYQAGRPPLKDEAYLNSITDPLHTFCDADFAGDMTKRSTTGNVTYLFGGPIMWISQLQKLHALSTAESEIYSATEAVKDAAFIKLLLTSLGIRDDKPIPVHEDNAACRIMSEERLKSYNRARHYVTRLGFLQDNHGTTYLFVPTDTSDMIADALTKPLCAETFVKFRDVLVRDVNSPIEGKL